jgi:hemoglobin
VAAHTLGVVAEAPEHDQVPSLFDWAGGRDALRRLIDAFYDRVERDELLSPFFPGGVSEDHRDHVTTWWAEVFGGPADYTEHHGGYARMLSHHLHLGITPEQRLRFATLMSQAADDAALPADPEFRAALVGYLEWGTRLAMGNSQAGADVVTEAPVPHWGWGVAPPYQPGA